jgi:ABC-2 type transport system permease protein
VPELSWGRAEGLNVFRATAARASRPALLWGVLFGGLAANEALGYDKSFPTHDSRQRFAESFGHNPGLAAVTGPARHLDTIEGFVAWRMFSLMLIIGSIWGLLTATRLLRGEEDAGRWELLLAGRTTRRSATGQALAGLAVGYLVLWAVTATCIVAAGLQPRVGFPVLSSLFYATAGTAGAAIFLTVGAFTSQLAGTRRQANLLAAGVFGLFYLVRLVADTVDGVGWLRWASPLGWVENLHPLTGARPEVLLLITTLLLITCGGTLALAHRRDVGTGSLSRGRPAAGGTGWLSNAVGLQARLDTGVALAWVIGLAMLGWIFGVVARSASSGHLADKTVGHTVTRLGGHGNGAAATSSSTWPQSSCSPPPARSPPPEPRKQTAGWTISSPARSAEPDG